MSSAQNRTKKYRVRVKARGTAKQRRVTRWNKKRGEFTRSTVGTKHWRTVQVKKKSRGRLAKHIGHAPGFHSLMGRAAAIRVRTWARLRRWKTDLIVVRVDRYPSLTGDVDAGKDLLDRLQRVADRLGVTIHIASGYRDYQEQAALYQAYISGTGNLAAPPGYSNHNKHGAADCSINGVNIGAYTGARDAMRAVGLCLPVRGESWHTEVGDTWRA